MNFVRKYVLNNLGLKLLSLAIAALLWWAVARDPLVEVAVNVPIEFYHVPEGLDISSETIPRAEIRVHGPARRVRSLNEENVHVMVDLAGSRPGEHTYELGGPQVHVPRGVDVVQVVPSVFRINLDKSISKQVPVRPRVIGSFLAGMQLAPEGVTADPSEVTIIGPEHHVQAVEIAITDPVDISGVVGRATFTTHVYVPDPLVRVQQNGTVHVTVTTEKSPKT
jgi:YbbR domain-containing protein